MPQKTKILIIDDEWTIRTHLAQKLADRMSLKFDYDHPEDSDSDFVLLTNHNDADSWMANNPGQCALIISDNNTGPLPKGVDWIADKIKKETFKDIPIFLLAGGLKADEQAHLLASGFPMERSHVKPAKETFYKAIESAYRQVIEGQMDGQPVISRGQGA